MKRIGELIINKLADNIIKDSFNKDLNKDITYNDDYFNLIYKKSQYDDKILIESEIHVQNETIIFKREFNLIDYIIIKIIKNIE